MDAFAFHGVIHYSVIYLHATQYLFEANVHA